MNYEANLTLTHAGKIIKKGDVFPESTFPHHLIGTLCATGKIAALEAAKESLDVKDSSESLDVKDSESKSSRKRRSKD